MQEKTLESPLDSKEIKPVHPRGNQPWIFIGRTDTKHKALILRPPDGKSQLTEKDLDAGKDWRQKKEAAEDEMVSITDSTDMSPGASEGQEAWHFAVHGVAESDMT